MAQNSSRVLLVVGAGGPTGSLCVRRALQEGYTVRAGSRSGQLPPALADLGDEPRVSAVVSDVRAPATLATAFRGADCALFCASASKQKAFSKDNDSEAVDRFGLIHCAEAAIANDVRRFVVVSSAMVTRPAAGIHRIISWMVPNLMRNKHLGEKGLKEAYATAGKPNLDYVIVRPGALTEKAPRGESSLRFVTGDLLDGEISREDVAAVSVAALVSPAASKATFECFTQGSEAMYGNMGVMTTVLYEATGYQWVPLELPEGYEATPRDFEELFERVKASA